MTLSEIASHVCEVVGTTDTESIALAKTFAGRRYRLIWDSHPWRETLGFTSFTAQATATTGPQDVVVPVAFERVLQIHAADEFSLDATEFTTRWLTDPQSFAHTGGSPLDFSLLEPSPFLVVAINEGVSFYNASSEDEGKTMSISYLSGDTRITETLTLTGTPTYAATSQAPTRFLSCSKPATTGAINVESTELVLQTTIAATVTESPLYPVIRLWHPLAASKTIRCLGKRPCSRLSADNDVALISNIAEPLIGLVQADMLERQRQYSKAAAKRAEAGALVAGLLVDLQRRQSADGMQIIPDMEPAPYGPGVNSQEGYW